MQPTLGTAMAAWHKPGCSWLGLLQSLVCLHWERCASHTRTLSAPCLALPTLPSLGVSPNTLIITSRELPKIAVTYTAHSMQVTQSSSQPLHVLSCLPACRRVPPPKAPALQPNTHGHGFRAQIPAATAGQHQGDSSCSRPCIVCGLHPPLHNNF